MTITPPKTLNERVNEITGTDELAILDYFDHDLWDTYDDAVDPLTRVSRKISSRLGRMLVFVEKMHDGIPPKVAFEGVMKMTVTDVNDHLRLDEAEDADETEGPGDGPDDGDKAETPAGKEPDDAPSAAAS